MPPDPSATLCMPYVRSIVLGLLNDVSVLQAANARERGYSIRARTDSCVLRARRNNPTEYVCPPILQSLDPPLLGACFPRKIVKIRCSEIASEVIFVPK